MNEIDVRPQVVKELLGKCFRNLVISVFNIQQPEVSHTPSLRTIRLVNDVII